jgi:hypothetical protein
MHKYVAIGLSSLTSLCYRRKRLVHLCHNVLAAVIFYFNFFFLAAHWSLYNVGCRALCKSQSAPKLARLTIFQP